MAYAHTLLIISRNNLLWLIIGLRRLVLPGWPPCTHAHARACPLLHALRTQVERTQLHEQVGCTHALDGHSGTNEERTAPACAHTQDKGTPLHYAATAGHAHCCCKSSDFLYVHLFARLGRFGTLCTNCALHLHGNNVPIDGITLFLMTYSAAAARGRARQRGRRRRRGAAALGRYGRGRGPCRSGELSLVYSIYNIDTLI